MHIEIQVALNFVISYLYNKLPRRRVNLFGEELDKALRLKFDGHWYPEKPFKGSAYRCLRIGSPLDPVIETAAQESGVELNDIRENLPEELSVWVDPGEVSYRIGEKGVVKILYAATAEEMSSGNSNSSDDTLLLDKEVTRSFNPEAQCFKPIESVSSSLSNLAVSPSGASSSASPFGASSPSPSFKSTSPIGNGSSTTSSSTGASAAFLPNKLVVPLTFTTATFAQTKFGSTKLKTNSKRSNRMSPTEFSNYIKQRAMMQQQSQPLASSFGPSPGSPQPPQRPRSLSPNPQSEQQHFLFGNQQQQQHQHHHLRGLFDNGYLGDLFGNISQQGKFPSGNAGANDASGAPFLSNTAAAMGINDNSKSLLDGINFNLNTMPYPNQSHHQHLLVAN